MQVRYIKVPAPRSWVLLSTGCLIAKPLAWRRKAFLRIRFLALRIFDFAMVSFLLKRGRSVVRMLGPSLS